MLASDTSPYEEAAPVPPKSVPVMKPPRVLLVEDDPGDALLVREMLLQPVGAWEAVNLCGWAKGIAEVAQMIDPGIDCVLLDLGLPDASGLDALTAMLDITESAAVIVLTGIDDEILGSRAVALGAQDFLAKGEINPEKLNRSIRYAIERKRGDGTRRRLREADTRRAENTRLERGLLPNPLIRSTELHWATRYSPGGGKSLLGGDFYDAVELDDGTLRFIVGDVCGHGPDEAAVGVALRVAWRTLVLAGVPAGEILPHLETVMVAERHVDYLFTTACDVILSADLTKAEVRLAGHPGPFRLDAGQVGPEPLDHGGPVLGVFADAVWEPTTIEMGREWTWMLYTDGLIVGLDQSSGERLETEGLTRIAAAALSDTDQLGTLADRIRRGVEAANGGPIADDLAMFLFSPSTRWQPG